ncbi:MAG: tyrosine-type recombinase/integrase, partial [Acidobacteriota bacterium]
RAALAKGEVGIRDRKPIPTLRMFAQNDFLPYVGSTFAAKVKTKAYYEYGVKSLLTDEKLASEPLDSITSEKVAGYVAKRHEDGLQIASINRQLQVLRRMLYLAQEWGKVEKVLPKVRMLSAERHRERSLTPKEEKEYLEAAEPLLHDVATILLDCGLRPEECFRLKWESVLDGYIEIQYGKTDNARRRIPTSPRVSAVLDMRRARSAGEWVFPAATASGHIEPASIKRQHVKACKGPQGAIVAQRVSLGEPEEPKWNIARFPMYTLRHTCLTRWAPHLDPWALAYVAGHRDMSITKRYIHPQQGTLRDSIEKARVANCGHTSGHTVVPGQAELANDTALKV